MKELPVSATGYGRGIDIHTKYLVDENGCWIWLGRLDRHGYGRYRLKKNKSTGAHRAVYQRLHGAIPPGLDLDHLCRVTACVNPDHLEPVTRAENLRRGLRIQSAITRAKCREGHSLLNDAVYYRVGNHKACKTCKRRYDAERYQRRLKSVAA